MGALVVHLAAAVELRRTSDLFLLGHRWASAAVRSQIRGLQKCMTIPTCPCMCAYVCFEFAKPTWRRALARVGVECTSSLDEPLACTTTSLPVSNKHRQPLI